MTKGWKKEYSCVLVIAVLLLGQVSCVPGTADALSYSEAGATERGQASTVVKVITKIITATPVPIPTPKPMVAALTPGQLEIHVLYVEHGDAQLIISPTGETMLIDVGRKEISSRVAEYLRQVLGELAVDYLMLSHYHIDHIQAFVPLMEEGLEIRRVILDRGGDRNEYDSDHYRSYYDYAADPVNGLKRVRVYPGDEIDMGADITIKVLAVGDVDSKTSCGVPTVGENDNSIALWLTYGDLDYWTAGDLSGVDSLRVANIESAVIPLLPRQVDVFRVNHHAIDENSNAEFLAALNPTVSIASSSYSLANRYIVRSLEEYGDVYITAQTAFREASFDIVLTSRDGVTYTVEGKTYQSK